MTNSLLALTVKNLRKQARLNQAALAQALGRDRTWVAHLERGALRPSREQLVALAAALGCPAEDLLSLGEERPEPGFEQDSNTKRLALKRFSSSWRTPEELPSDYSGLQRSVSQMMATFVRDLSLRRKLERMCLVQRQACHLAQCLLQRGGQLARIALSQLGFPMPVLDRQGQIINHCPRHAIVLTEGNSALAIMGAVCARWPRFLPSVVAVATPEQNSFWVIDDPVMGPLPPGGSLQDYSAFAGPSQRQLPPGVTASGRVARWGERFGLLRLRLKDFTFQQVDEVVTELLKGKLTT